MRAGNSFAWRTVRGVARIAALAAALSCADQPPVAPKFGAPGRARLAVAPGFQPAPPGAPTVDLSKVRGVLIGVNGDSTIVEAKFDGDSAVLTFEVQFPGASANFTLDLTAFDNQNVVAYHASQNITLKPGDNESVPALQLVYAAPDAALTTLHVSPNAITLNAGASSGLGVSGSDSHGQSVPSIRVGWTSRDPSVATVDDAGGVHAGAFQGQTYIIARTVLNLADSALVKVHAPVDHIVVAPASLQIIRGLSGAVGGELRDAGNHLIDDRTATWSSSDPSVATVSSSGVIQAIKNGAATITATAEGKTASASVTVVTPVDHVELTPGSLTFASLNETQSVSARVVPKTGASVDGIVPVLASSNSGVASIDASGVVTAHANGSTSITATADGVTATAGVTVQQVPTSVTISPKSAGVTYLGASAAFSATASDALGSPLANGQITFSSSNTSVATVSANGVAVGRANGTATITATAGGKSDAAQFTVAQVPAGVAAFADHGQIQVGQTAQLGARLVDGGGNAMGAVTATWTALTPSIATTTSSGVVTGVSTGTAKFSGTALGFTGLVGMTIVPGPNVTPLTLSPATAEKLPNGTQQFTIASGGPGPYTWTVNGTVGGNSTFGTIDTSGFYTAPGAVPTPSTFDVCAARQAAPAERGCSHVTINPVPTSGSDVIVFNDANIFDNTADQDANNQRLYANIVGFTGSGPRASQSRALVYFGHASLIGGIQTFDGLSLLNSGATLDGIAIDTSSADVTAAFPASYKVIFVVLPTATFSNSEINFFKQFSADGGRIVFIGENVGFYGPNGIATENDFLSKMGAQMTNTGGLVDCGYHNLPASSIRTQHQVATGLTGLTMACASIVNPGPNDFAILYSVDGQSVIAGAAKVDVTPLSTSRVPPRRVLDRAPRASGAGAARTWPNIDPATGQPPR